MSHVIYILLTLALLYVSVHVCIIQSVCSHMQHRFHTRLYNMSAPYLSPCVQNTLLATN